MSREQSSAERRDSPSIHVLALNPNAPGPTTISNGDLDVTVERFTQRLYGRASQRVFNLLVLCNLGPEAASRVAGRLQRLRRWQKVPVLYVLPAGEPGVILPGAYRLELDAFTAGRLESSHVLEAMRERALPAVDPFPGPSLGPYRIDRAARLLDWPGGEVQLAPREAEVLAVLFEARGEYVPAAIIAGALSSGPGARPATSGMAKRYVSRLRATLAGVTGAPVISNKRGTGYRAELPDSFPVPP